jgi:cytochrome c553
MLPYTNFLKLWFGCVCAFTLVFCDGQPAQESPQKGEPSPATESVLEHMGEHFEQVVAVQKAIIRGDLDSTSEPAIWMAQHHSVIGAPEGWAPHIKEMREAARTAADASTLKAAAGAAASMSRTCGKCHEAVDTSPRIPELGTIGLPPSDHIAAVPHMHRHNWAVEQMWMGLVTPSEETWKKGVEALNVSPLEPHKMTDDANTTADVGGWAQSVHEIGARATQEQDWDKRAQLFGELLGTCARCHQALELTIDLH